MELNKEIIINGVDQSTLLSSKVSGFTIKESENFEVSSLSLELDNSNNKIVPPTKNAQIELNIGYKQVYKMGKFVVQLIENNHKTISLIAPAQDLQKGRIKQNRVFGEVALQAILNTIASSLNLTPQLDPILATAQIPYLLQSNQTDLSLLHELGELFYAIAMVKDGNLVFWGKDSPPSKAPIILNDNDILNITYKDTEFKVYRGVKANYWDTKTATLEVVKLGDEPCLLVPAIYGLELTKQLVKSRYKQTQQKQTLELILNGNPQIQVGVVITIPPSSNYIDYLGSYKVTGVKHVYDGQKYTTYLSACKVSL